MHGRCSFLNFNSKKQIQATADILIIGALTTVLSTQTIIRSNCENVLFRWHRYYCFATFLNILFSVSHPVSSLLCVI